METEQHERKLGAILYADVAGYSRLTGADEAGTHRTLFSYLDVFTKTIDTYRGNVVHYAGDVILAEFDMVSDALAKRRGRARLTIGHSCRSHAPVARCLFGCAQRYSVKLKLKPALSECQT